MHTESIKGTFADGSTLTCRQTSDDIEQGLLFEDSGVKWFPDHDLCPFHDGRSVVMHKKRLDFGVIDRQGNTIVDCIHPGITSYTEGRAFIWDETTKLIDTNGQIIKEFNDSLVGDSFHDGLSIVSVIDGDEKVDGFVDRDGECIIPCMYRNPIVNPYVHDEDDCLSEGLIRVRIDKRTGYINKSNAMVIEPIYEWGGRFSSGRACIHRDGFAGYINHDAEIVFPIMLTAGGAFTEGLAPVCFDDLWGYVNLEGDIAIEPRFLNARSFVNGETIALAESGWGMINTDGKFIIPPMYESLTLFEDGVAKAVYHGKQGFIDRQNRGIWGNRIFLPKTQ
jgi:hypothetical protein